MSFPLYGSPICLITVPSSGLSVSMLCPPLQALLTFIMFVSGYISIDFYPDPISSRPPFQQANKCFLLRNATLYTTAENIGVFVEKFSRERKCPTDFFSFLLWFLLKLSSWYFGLVPALHISCSINAMFQHLPVVALLFIFRITAACPHLSQLQFWGKKTSFRSRLPYSDIHKSSL